MAKLKIPGKKRKKISIQEQAILEIAERDRERFMEELTTLGAPGNGLKKAVKHYQQIFTGK